MSKGKREKNFDCIAYTRQQRDRLDRIQATMTYDEFTEWLDAREYSDPRLARLKKLKKRDRAETDPYPVDSGGLRTPKFSTPAEILNEWARARGEPEEW